eukprot:TRINITY_DN4785_c0_g1_i2.p2 TRINITY_DN4785_c0_g1~~TRINITY_DN4785_c0_g1_i2.p2  ORF type:complete len:126 (-),score=13.90 TRINITY_DN4785_c0_g1_i2:58-435(-)
MLDLRDRFLVFVFSLTQQYTLNSFDKFYERWLRTLDINNISEADYRNKRNILLVGNKIDLADSRVVPREDAVAKAKKYAVPYIETSCKTREGVEAVFHCVARLQYLSEVDEYNAKKPETARCVQQ